MGNVEDETPNNILKNQQDHFFLPKNEIIPFGIVVFTTGYFHVWQIVGPPPLTIGGLTFKPNSNFFFNCINLGGGLRLPIVRKRHSGGYKEKTSILLTIHNLLPMFVLYILFLLLKKIDWDS